VVNVVDVAGVANVAGERMGSLMAGAGVDVGTTIDPDVVAAGAVLWRPVPGGAAVEVAVVHRPRYDDWSLPKGKLGRGESIEAAAVREVSEETGSAAALGVRLGESHYRVPQGEKVVHYWSARTEGDTAGAFTPNSEVDELRWLPLAGVEALLSYDRDSEVLARFRTLSPSGAPPRPLLLVRHAKAGNRHTWSADDDLRPLSGKGHQQAEHLAGLLSLFGPARAYAAPPVRCPQTLGPLAERLGLDIAAEPLLGEAGYWDDPDAGLARLLELARGPEVAVVCSQGGVIPDLVERLTDRPEPPARKASTWVLGFSGDQVVTADHYPAPEH
jgi:8-oxo-dGTP diphosphatase